MFKANRTKGVNRNFIVKQNKYKARDKRVTKVASNRDKTTGLN